MGLRLAVDRVVEIHWSILKVGEISMRPPALNAWFSDQTRVLWLGCAAFPVFTARVSLLRG
ncbi:hypothetical protein METHP14_30057 [Pseudomonas sp. P14-2025]